MLEWIHGILSRRFYCANGWKTLAFALTPQQTRQALFIGSSRSRLSISKLWLKITDASPSRYKPSTLSYTSAPNQSLRDAH
jgi:hypothetical protein